MAGKIQSERTLKMKQSFMELHNQGLSIHQIAEKFSLSYVTVYAHLEEIATANGVTRDSLLRAPNGPHLNYSRQASYHKFSQVNLEEHRRYAQETLREFDQTIANVDQYISAQTEIQSGEGAEC